MDWFVHVLTADRRPLFWPIWIVLTAALMAATVALVRPRPVAVPPLRSAPLRAAAYGPLIVLLAFFCLYSVAILAGEDFALYDNSQFTAFSIRGIEMPPPIWPDTGRFFPLGLRDHIWLGFVVKSIEGFHILSLLQLAVTMAAFIAVLSDELSLAASAAVTMFAVSMPAVVTSFGCLIATERNVVLLTACLFYCVRRYESTGLKCYAVGAVLAAQYMLYCKEIVFLMLFGFAAARIVLRWWIKPSGGIQLGHPDNRLDLLFAAQSLAFLVFYAFMMFPHSEAAYIERNQMSAVQLIRHYLVLVPGALPFLVFCCVRFFQIVRARVVPDPDWDAFAFAGLVYLAALWVLRFGGWYYSAPVDVVGVVCMGRLLCLWWPRASLSPVRRIAAALVVLFLAEQGLAIGIRNILDRKTMIHRKSRIAGLIADRMRREAGATAIDVHVPLSNGYVMSEFASYLSYRGLPLEEDPPAILPGGQQPRIRIFLGQFTKDARCFWARPFVCRAGAPAAPALTIVLPEDNWQSGQPAAYAAFERQMLEADPGIAPPVWMTRVLEWCWSLDFE